MDWLSSWKELVQEELEERWADKGKLELSDFCEVLEIPEFAVHIVLEKAGFNGHLPQKGVEIKRVVEVWGDLFAPWVKADVRFHVKKVKKYISLNPEERRKILRQWVEEKEKREALVREKIQKCFMPPAELRNQGWLTLNQASRLFKIKRERLWNAVKNGELNARMIVPQPNYQMWIVQKKDVEKFAEKWRNRKRPKWDFYKDFLPADRDWYTVPEVAKMSKRSPWTIQKAIRRGDLKAEKIVISQKKILWKVNKEDYEEWLRLRSIARSK